MSYDLNRIKLEMKEVCRKANVEFNIPVRLNGRLSRTLGRVHQECHNGTWEPVSVEFSKQLLETASDESIRDVILHETAHVIATIRTGESCGHNSYFKKVCAEIGTTNDGTTTKVERTVSEETLQKYSLYCDGGCGGKFLGGYSRMGKNLKNLDACTCRLCGQSKFRLVQNW